MTCHPSGACREIPDRSRGRFKWPVAVLFAMATVAMTLGGCSTRKLMVGQVAGVMADGFGAYMKEPDPVLVKESMAPNLKLIEALMESDPDNEDLLLLAAQGFASDAFLFVEAENPERAKALYKRAENYGFDLLAQRGLLPENVYSLNAWDQALSRAGKEDVPAVFWTAFAWGGRIQLDRESPTALADLPIVIRMVEQAARLDRPYWFAGPDTFLGFYNGSVPVPLGGRPGKAQAHFDAALGMTDRQSLMIQVLYARSYAVQVQDRQLFDALLGEVLNADLGAMPPETALSNAVARRRAQELIVRGDEYFQ